MPKTWVGWVVYLVGGLVALLLAGAALLFFLLPRTQLKGEFEAQLERATGRDVAIGGDLSLAFFPVLGFRAEQVSIANVPGGHAANLAQAGSIAAGLEILPYLLRRQVVVDRLVLVDPVIALELDAQGRPNWTLTPPPGTQPTPPAQGPALQDFALKEIRVTGGRISYVDRRDNDSWLIENADLTSAIESLDKPIRLRGALGWKGQRVELDATVAQPRAAMHGQQTGLTADVRSELLTAHVEGQLAGASETFAGDVRAEGPSLRRLSAWLATTIAPGAGLENFFVNGRLTIDRSKFAFENASLKLDALEGRGDFVLEGAHGRPYVSGRLELKGLDINPYLGAAPPVAEGAAVTVEAAAAATIANAPDARRPWPTTPIELGVLKSVDANLELYIKGPFKAQRVQADAAELSMVLNQGFLAATLTKLELYGGRGSGRIEIDARAPAVRLAQELSVQGVRANDFLRDAFGFENLEGAADVTLNWRGEGATPDALISSLDGRVTLAAREGAIRGVDLGGISRTIRNAFNGDLVNPNARTRFSNFSGSFAIADGVMATDDLRVQLPDLRVDTLGLINLGAQTMNVRITPREGGIAVPFVVRGAWSQLAYNSDLRGRERPAIESAVRAVKAAAPRAAPAR
ncbi:MAG: AsmA family protein [Hyphomonadaceae bacterium]|nr:AsmA family protein [Hyphomonadaceae bacterium]